MPGPALRRTPLVRASRAVRRAPPTASALDVESGRRGAELLLLRARAPARFASVTAASTRSSSVSTSSGSTTPGSIEIATSSPLPVTVAFTTPPPAVASTARVRERPPAQPACLAASSGSAEHLHLLFLRVRHRCSSRLGASVARTFFDDLRTEIADEPRDGIGRRRTSGASTSSLRSIRCSSSWTIDDAAAGAPHAPTASTDRQQRARRVEVVRAQHEARLRSRAATANASLIVSASLRNRPLIASNRGRGTPNTTTPLLDPDRLRLLHRGAHRRLEPFEHVRPRLDHVVGIERLRRERRRRGLDRAAARRPVEVRARGASRLRGARRARGQHRPSCRR